MIAINCTEATPPLVITRAITAIVRDIDDAIETLQKKPSFLTEAVASDLRSKLPAFCEHLWAVAREANGTFSMGAFYHYLKGHPEVRLFALVRAYAKAKQPFDPAKIDRFSAGWDVFKPLSERVLVHWKTKTGGWRPIVNFGPKRRAQCMILRDALELSGVGNPNDCGRRGGEKRLASDVCDAIEDGNHFVWAADIRNFYMSLNQGHFGWLHLDRRLLRNVVYLPKCAEIVIRLPKEGGPSALQLQEQYDSLLDSAHLSIGDLDKLSISIVRRGLPQGSPLSPLLASTFVGRLVSDVVPKHLIWRAYVDDIVVCAPKVSSAQAARRVVTKILKSHPAGKIELKGSKPRNAHKGSANVLGYRLQPDRRYGGGIHIKPGHKRVDRFKQGMAARLDAANAETSPYTIGERYRRAWFDSQQAWTKVPGFSDEASKNYAQLYVENHVARVPLGFLGYSPTGLFNPNSC